MDKYNDEEEICDNCKKKFIKRLVIYPCKCDEKRDSFYVCPYCGRHYSILLQGDEDVFAIKFKTEG